ncbi:MAG: hypothetical protein ACI4I3_03245, partial [Acutalibacteraceae bacterium]
MKPNRPTNWNLTPSVFCFAKSTSLKREAKKQSSHGENQTNCMGSLLSNVINLRAKKKLHKMMMS